MLPIKTGCQALYHKGGYVKEVTVGKRLDEDFLIDGQWYVCQDGPSWEVMPDVRLDIDGKEQYLGAAPEKRLTRIDGLPARPIILEASHTPGEKITV